MSHSSDPTGHAPLGVASGAARASAPLPGGVASAEAAARGPQTGRKAPGRRQTRVVVRKLGPWSVFKVSVFFYTCITAVLVLAAVILYAILTAAGSLTALTRLLQDLFGDESFQIHGAWILARLAVMGGVMVVVWSLINVFVVFLYNLISGVIGGLEITLGERG